MRILPEYLEQIVEVFHSAVDHAELHRGLKLLGYNRFYGVHTQSRSCHRDQHGIDAIFSRRRYRVAETDVDLQRDDRVVEHGFEGDANAVVLLVFPNLFGLHRVCIEENPVVFDGRGDDLPNHGRYRGGRGLSRP